MPVLCNIFVADVHLCLFSILDESNILNVSDFLIFLKKLHFITLEKSVDAILDAFGREGLGLPPYSPQAQNALLPL